MERMGIREWIGIWIVWRIGTRVPSWRPTDLPRQLAGLLRSVRSLGDLASYAVSSLHGFAPGQARERVGHLPIRAFERPSLDVRRRLVPLRLPSAGARPYCPYLARTLAVPSRLRPSLGLRLAPPRWPSAATLSLAYPALFSPCPLPQADSQSATLVRRP